MRIKELEIDNFKSFANKAEIPFLQGFTTISGPNGSGKSNIIDSILFALGLASSRTLRSESGVADFITSHNNRGEAYVKVTFEMDDGQDVSFARRVKKTSQGYTSTYYTNDKTCTLTQIHLELEKYNITPNSYNVIMQGDVTSIINCSSSERRKILDEIAGVADFDRKIEQAMRELETVDERVARSNIILGEIDSRIEQLSQDRETALKYKALRDQKNTLEGQISTVKYFDTKRSLDLVHENILNADKEKKKIQNEQKKYQENIVKQSELCKAISDEVRAKGEDKQLEVKKQAEEKKGEISRKRTALEHCDKLIFDNLKTIDNSKNGIDSLSAKNTETEAIIAEKNNDLQAKNDILTAQKEELESILSQMGGLNKTANEYIEKRNTLRHELDSKKDYENNLIKESLPVESKYNALKTESAKITEDLAKFENSAKNFNDEKDRLTLLTKTLQEEMQECEEVQKITLQDLDKVKAQISDMNYNINLATKKITSMEAKKQAFKEYGLGTGVSLVMSSNLKGVHAPLVQLLDVEAKYQDAINIALGARSRFIVVDDENVAVRAIDLLKSNDERATFLPLNKIHKAPTKLALPKDKGVVDFAINLIDFDDEYLDAFYFALSDTLIVEDTQTAKKLMGKYRVITLDGDIFEKSGAITGGAKVKQRSAFSKTEDNELKTYKERLKEFEKKFTELEDKKFQLEKRLDKVRNDYINAKNEYSSSKIELQRLIDDNSKITTQIEQGMLRQAQVASELKELSSKLDSYEEKQMVVQQDILRLQGEFEEIEKLIDEGELNKLKEMTADIDQKIKATEGEIFAIQAEIEKQKNNINFNNTIIDQRKADIEKLTDDNLKIKEDKTRFTGEIEAHTKELNELEVLIVELGAHLVELQAKRDAANQELLNLQKQSDVLDNQAERIQEQLESYRARRRELEPLLEQAREVLIEQGLDLSKLEEVTISIEEITSKIARLQKKMDELEPVNMRALTDYDEVIARQTELREKILTLHNEKIEISTRMQGYENLKKETFLTTFKAVNSNFKDIFSELSEGEGKLILENEENPFMGGLTFEASTRDKPKQRLAGMSGGEKTLMALAFVFSMQRYQPAPFYAMDEVDMHLDGPNVEKLAKMINKQASIAQFIVISLRKPMIDSADRMIGVTQKEKGKTKISGIRLKDE